VTISESDVAAAADRIAPYVRKTPVLTTSVGDRPVTFKLEHLQLTGSFKVRGALNAMLHRADASRPVVTASGGNHGLGVAAAAAMVKVPATVFVPESVPAAKARRIEAAGATVIRHGQRYADAMTAALAHADRTGDHYLPAYDDPNVVAGQGTVGREIGVQAPDCDSVVIAVGGGGLLAGIRAALPSYDLVGVEPPGCATLHAAVAAGRPVDVELDSVTVSALGATRLGLVPFEVLRARPVRLAMVDDAAILAARDQLWEDFRLAVEPAAAAPFAALLAGLAPGDHPCLVLCGANTGWQPCG